MSTYFHLHYVVVVVVGEVLDSNGEDCSRDVIMLQVLAYGYLKSTIL